MSIKFSSFVALFASMAIAAPAIWDGTADVSWYKPDAQKFTLMTAEELAGVAKLVNEGITDFSGQTIALGADIFLNDTAGAGAGTWASISRTSWIPIGTSAKPFKGEFDGIAGKKNRKIYGLYINDTTQNYVGLFGYTSNVKISNLDVLVGRLIAKSYVGALIGCASDGSVTNVHSEIKVTGVSHHVGGLVGGSTGSLSSSSVKENVVGLDYVGGLVGSTSGPISGTAKSNSYFIGNVTGGNYVGGVVGRSSSRISNSFAEGSVKGDSSYVGGVAGFASGSIDSVHHVGGDVSGFAYVGGLAGKGSSISKSYAEGYVKGVSNYVGGVAGQVSGTVDSVHHVDGDVTGLDYVGGVVGYTIGAVDSAYHAGGDISGNTYVGGLVGYGTSITRSYAEGHVIGVLSYIGGVVGRATGLVSSTRHIGGDVSGYTYVGGIVGHITGADGVYVNGLNVGDVNGYSYVGGVVGYTECNIEYSSSRGNVNGKGDYIGGLAGFAIKSVNTTGSSSTCSSSIKDSYSIGNVTGKKYVGGLIGKDSIYKELSLRTPNSCFYGKCYSSLIRRKIVNSYSKGAVEGKSYVGGLIGASGIGSDSLNHYVRQKYMEYIVQSCYHSGGLVHADSNYVGGLIGYAEGEVASSYHTDGNVSGLDYVGGLIGLAMNKRMTIRETGYDIYADITYIEQSYAIGNVKGRNYVGGVVGADSIYKILRQGGCSGKCYGQISRIVSKISSEGTVEGHAYVGGVVGKQSAGSDSLNKYSNACGNNYYLNFANNSINHLGGSVYADSDYVGGVFGYAIGPTDSTYHMGGNISGYRYIGGLAGKICDSVTNSYSKGNVTGKSSYVGGLVGSGGLISKSYAEGHVISDSGYVGGVAGFAGRIDFASHAGGDVSGHYCVGGLVGYGSNISKSYAEGRVNGVSNYVGGVAGKASGTIDSTYHTGGDVGGRNYVGGIVGDGVGVLRSYAEGRVNGDSNYVGGVAGRASEAIDSTHHIGGDVCGRNYVGGVVGQTTSSVMNSYSEGNVIGALDYIGGAAGSISGGIRNSHADAKFVKGRNLVGGLVGYIGGSIDVSYLEGDSVSGNFEIGGLVGCAKSSVDSSYSTANVKGDDNVGGLIGSAYGDVLNSYALGNVDGVGEGAGAGHDNLGGLVGYQYRGSISKSMALGNVSGTTNLGGLVGRFDGETVSQSYANGSVTGSYYGDPADEIGNYYIGGLVGYAKGSLEEVYASGVVKGVEDEPVYTGCVVGYVNGSLSVTKSYYDETKCDLGIDGGEETATVSGSPNKTTAEMQIQETFEDWDFAETWKIKEKAYPFLQIYSNSLTNAVVTTVSLKGIKYDGTAKTPLVTSVSLFGETLEYESEYTITYKDNVNAGTATINVCGVKPYGGCKVVEFEIAGIAIKPTMAAIEDVTYTGRAQTPEIEVYNGETLLAATDYAVEYMDNVNAGTATVTVTMKGNYRGSALKTFTIEKATPVINQNPTASDVILGQTLAASELRGGRTNVDGEFVWKTPTAKPELENEGYAVVFVPTDTNYTKSAEIAVPVKVLDLVYVVVHVGDNTLDSTALVKGGSYTLPNVPDSIGYDFVGLYKGKTLVGKSGDQIDISENTVIEAIYKIQTFVITFMNGSTVLQSDAVDYGTIPDAPIVTLPENTAQYTYSFVGWDKDIVTVTETATYTAVIDSVVNKYEVVFNDYDGTALMDSVYEYGTAAANIARPISPTRISTAQYTYTFEDWSPSVTDVTEDVVYTATFDSTVNTYQIAFINAYDETQSVEMDVEYGEIPVYEGTPTRNATAQYAYTFSGWSPEVGPVAGNAAYTALFDSTLQKYVISFVNGSEELQSENLAYGVLPEYEGTAPTKTATARYTYTFTGWIPEIAEVTGIATYEAVFDSVVNKYLITFKSGSTTLQSDSVAYGTVPEYPTVTLPENTAQYTYSMSWDKDIEAVSGDAVYTATVDSVVNKYEISFKNYDGTLIKDSVYVYGSTVVKPAEPTRIATAKYNYIFKGWTPTVASVTAETVYKAVFDSTIRSYTITFVNDSDTLQSNSINYGTVPSYKGKTPKKASTKEYTYTFKGWSPSIEAVSNIATYKAIFDSTVKTYKVTFMNGNKKVQTSNVAYGEMPVYSGSTPTKVANDSCTYTFSGWSPEIQPVTDDVIYSAEFSEAKKKFLVRFINGNYAIDVQSVTYGDIPKYMGVTPTKKSTSQYSYEFVGWTPEIGPIFEETNYEAVFDSTDLTGMTDKRFAKLEMSVNVVSRNIQISAAPIGSAYAILDMQGRVLKKGRVESANFNITMPQAGNYMIRIGNHTQRISIK